MKVAVECNSILLQKALESFLSKHLTTSKSSDIVVRDFKSDDKRTFFISNKEGSDLKKPFSKSQLFLALENRYKELEKNPKKEFPTNTNQVKNFEILEKRIEMLTQEYKNNILQAIKAFYG